MTKGEIVHRVIHCMELGCTYEVQIEIPVPKGWTAVSGGKMLCPKHSPKEVV